LTVVAAETVELPSKPRRHPLANCEACPFFYDDYAYVPSFGPPKADIAIVGQNPGQQEIKIGKPFTGPSGRLLDAVLKEYKLDRSRMFITNACLCVHRNENVKPPTSAVTACRPRLIAELKDREVKQVVALGNVPAQGLLQVRSAITSLRVGTWREIEDLSNVQILCTYHPAACLRSPAFFPSVCTDFGKLVHPPPPWKEPRFVVWEDEDTALRGIAELRRRKITTIALDLEWATPADKDVSFDHPYRYKILVIGIAISEDQAIVIGTTASQSERVRYAMKLYLRECKVIITQNGKSDKQGAYANGFDFDFSEDTMLQSYALDERTGIHGLKVQLEEKLGYPRYVDEIKEYLGKGKAKSFANIPKDILYKYNAYDTCGTFALWHYNRALIDADDFVEPVRPRHDGERWGLSRLHKFMVETSNNLAFVELNGFPVDLEYNKKLVVEYDGTLRGLEQDMFNTIGGTKFNPRSPKQLQKIFADMGVRLPLERRPNGTISPTTNAAALKDLYEKYKSVKLKGTIQATLATAPDNALGQEVFQVVDTRSVEVRFLEALLEYRKAAKLNGTYIRGLRKMVYKGRVYPTVMVHSTVSGRTSQRKPSLQVIPHAEFIKRQFVTADYRKWLVGDVDPLDAHVLMEFDYKQIELRVLTWLAQEPYFREVFADPSRDLFTELADIVKPERSKKTNMHPKDRRNIVKAFVYGLAYGREAGSIADEYEIPLADALRMQREFFGVIPKVVEFREQVKWQAINQDDLITPFGRRKRVWLITAENKKDIQNEACSFYPQSIASDILIQAFNVVRPALKGKAWIRNLVHDAIFAECREADLEYVSDYIIRTMIESAYAVMGDYVRIDVDAEVGRTWGDLCRLDEWKEGKRPYPTGLARRNEYENPSLVA
jgi:DNA polymerase